MLNNILVINVSGFVIVMLKYRGVTFLLFLDNAERSASGASRRRNAGANHAYDFATPPTYAGAGRRRAPLDAVSPRVRAIGARSWRATGTARGSGRRPVRAAGRGGWRCGRSRAASSLAADAGRAGRRPVATAGRNAGSRAAAPASPAPSAPCAPSAAPAACLRIHCRPGEAQAYTAAACAAAPRAQVPEEGVAVQRRGVAVHASTL